VHTGRGTQIVGGGHTTHYYMYILYYICIYIHIYIYVYVCVCICILHIFCICVGHTEAASNFEKCFLIPCEYTEAAPR
jgi:hypothetical protein